MVFLVPHVPAKKSKGETMDQYGASEIKKIQKKSFCSISSEDTYTKEHWQWKSKWWGSLDG